MLSDIEYVWNAVSSETWDDSSALFPIKKIAIESFVSRGSSNTSCKRGHLERNELRKFHCKAFHLKTSSITKT